MAGVDLNNQENYNLTQEDAMRRIFIFAVCLILALPGVALGETKTVYKSFGHGPLKGEMSTPVTIIATDKLHVFDGSTKRVSIYTLDGEFQESFPLDIPGDNFDPAFFPFQSRFVSLCLNPEGYYCFLSGGNIEVVSKTGSKIKTVNLSGICDNPVSFAVAKSGYFYVLDLEKCVVVLDSDGKEIKKIGEIGPGRSKVLNPSKILLDKAGNVIVIDNPETDATELDESKRENLVNIFDSTGRFITDFGKQTSIGGDDHELFSPSCAAVSGDNIVICDIELKDLTASWVAKRYKTNGDFMEKTLIPKIEDSYLMSFVSDIAITDDESMFFSYPLGGCVKNAKDLTIGKAGKNSFISPSSAISLPDGTIAVTELLPAKLTLIKGKDRKSLALKSEFSTLPGVDINIGADVAYVKNEILVATGTSVARYDSSSLKNIGSYELSTVLETTGLTIAMTAREGKVYVLDSIGNVIIFSGGIPSLFKAFKSDRDSALPKDIAVDKEGSIFVLHPEEKSVNVFSETFEFQAKHQLEGAVHPTSISFAPTGELVACDGVLSKIFGFTATGKLLWEKGDKGALENRNAALDYDINPGKFHIPSKVRCSNDGTITVVDYGNMRVQTISEEDVKPPPPPDKKPPMLSLSTSSLNFGKIYFEDEKSLSIDVKNLGEIELSGKVILESDIFETDVKTIDEKTRKIIVKATPSIVDCWQKFNETMVIETNGGNMVVGLNAEIVGKVVEMQIGNNIFVVTTDKSEPYKSSRAPVINANRTFVPLRALGEALGAKVEYVASEKKVVYQMGNVTIEMWLGKKEAAVNGKPLKLDNPPLIISGSTYVPVRFVAENLGADTEYIAATKTVKITYPKAAKGY